jgi:peptidoglycan/LPS O-acetylase OafA/YrhL
VVLAVGVLLIRRRRRDREWRALGIVLIATAGFAVFHLATAVLGDGYAELGKHVFPAVVDTWLVPPLVLLGAAGGLVRRDAVRACN